MKTFKTIMTIILFLPFLHSCKKETFKRCYCGNIKRYYTTTNLNNCDDGDESITKYWVLVENDCSYENKAFNLSFDKWVGGGRGSGGFGGGGSFGGGGAGGSW